MTSSIPEPTSAPVRERGYVDGEGGSWWTQALAESAPELQWPNNIRIYDRMRRTDPQVQSVLRAVTLPIRRTPWRVHPNGADPRVVEHVAQDLGLPIVGAEDTIARPRTRGRFSWYEHLRLALLSLVYGHMPFEQVYWIEGSGASARARLRKLGPRMPLTIAKFNTAADGGLVSLEQHARGLGIADGPVLKMSQLVMYVNEREGANWTGHSLLRSAYKNWLLKDRALRVDAMSLDRNGLGIPVYEAAENETDLTAGRKLAASVRAGEDAGAAVPHGAKLTLQGVQGQLPDGLARIRYHDQAMTSAVLAQFLNLGQNRGTGSWALGATLGDFFTLSLGATADDVRDIANAHVVEDIVDLNYGEDEPAPRIVHDPIGSRTAEIAQALQMLIQAGVIEPDAQLEEFMRAALDLPTGGDDKADPDDPDADPTTVRETPRSRRTSSSTSGGGTGSRSSGKSSEAGELKLRAETVGILARSGFDPESAAREVGLPEIKHTGMLPVSIKDFDAETSPTPGDDREDDDQ